MELSVKSLARIACVVGSGCMLAACSGSSRSSPVISSVVVKPSVSVAKSSILFQKDEKVAREIQSLVVDGVTIDLHAGIDEQAWYVSEEKDGTRYLVNHASFTPNVRVGWLEKSAGDHYFLVGKTSSNIPQEGHARYHVQAVYDVKLHGKEGPVRMKEGDLVADFGAKTLTGELFYGGSVPFVVNAKILGSRFSNAIHDDSNQVSGAFFGDDAAEIAGGLRNQVVKGAFFGHKVPEGASAVQR